MNVRSPEHESNNSAVMTNDALGREQCYRIAMALAKSLRTNGIIDDTDYRKIDRLMLARFRPVLAGLYPEKPDIAE